MRSEGRLPLVRPALPPLEDVDVLLAESWASGTVTTGPLTRALESEAADRLGVEHAVMVNHGATALMLAVRALGLKGEVIIPSFSWSATASSLVWNGIDPVFADIRPGRLTLDPASAEAAITERTSAIMPVNVFGVPPEMDEFTALAERYGLRLVHDTAQGLGSMYQGVPCGGFGDAECFSLSPTKVVTSLEGGLVTTDDAPLAAAVRSMRDSGKSPDGMDIVHVGLSGRPSEAHAAVGLLNLRRADALLARRRSLVARYRTLLSGTPGVRVQEEPAGVESTHNYFVVQIDERETGTDREAVYRALSRRGIQAKRYFYPAIHLQSAFTEWRERSVTPLPVTEQAAARGLALPLYHAMTDDDVERVAAVVADAVASGAAAI